MQSALPPETDLSQLIGVLPVSKAATSSKANVLDAAPENLPSQAATEVIGKGQVDVEVIPTQHLDDSGAEMPDHVFEKVETLEEYQGTPRKTDDDDALDDHEEALRELDMRQLLRTPERPCSCSSTRATPPTPTSTAHASSTS